jgi:hypothetical protein
MQKIAEAVIVIVGRRAGDVAKHVLPLGRLADLMQTVIAFVGENILSEFKHGAFLRMRRP